MNPRNIWLALSFILLALPARADEIKIGTTLSLTGAYANYGRNALHGIELAIEEVNKVGPNHFTLVVEDFGSMDLKRAASAIRKFVSLDKIQIYLPLIVEDAEVTVPFASTVPLFSMAVGCGARKCSSNIGKYLVRAPASHDGVIDRLADYSKRKGLQNICVIGAESTYYNGYSDYITERSRAQGQKVNLQRVPWSNSEDYRAVATRFSHEKCDGVYAWIPIGSAANFFRRLRENGYSGVIFSGVETDDPVILEGAGAAGEGVVFARFAMASSAFIKRWEERFGEPLLRPGVPAYDGTKLLLETVNRVGTDATKLYQGITQLRDAPATNGTITYTAEGERLGETIELMKVSGGKVVPVGE